MFLPMCPKNAVSRVVIGSLALITRDRARGTLGSRRGGLTLVWSLGLSPWSRLCLPRLLCHPRVCGGVNQVWA